jgi:RNA polymerase sigma-70 factor (ECF subfamily)
MVTFTDKHKDLAALLAAGLNGDGAAYTRFLEQVTHTLKRLVILRIGAADSDDVVQDILISIHKARHTFDGTRPLMPWIIAIARFRISDYLRKHYATMKHQTIDISGLEEILADVTDDTSASESIADLLHDVPEREKRILMMMHVEGFTAKQIGDQMNMSVSAVKVAAHRAVKKLREKAGA